MLSKKAGIGISFCSTSNLVDAVADYVIKEPDFQQLVPILNWLLYVYEQ